VSDAQAEATRLLDAHKRSIDDLHQKLAAMAGSNKERLAGAAAKLRTAFAAFHDDALGSVSGGGGAL
jgi:hypothetical protein